MTRLQRHMPDAAIILALLLLPLVFFFQQTLGGKTLIPADVLYTTEPYRTYAEVVGAPEIPQNGLVADLIWQNYQWKSFIRQQLAQNEIPLWNPHQFSGIPFLAAGQHSALYPLSVVYYTLDLAAAYGWFTVLNLWLAGVFMMALARGLGIGRAAALLAGIIYQFSGFVIASVVFQMMIGGLPWLPLLLLMTEYILREKSVFGQQTVIPWVAIGAGALGMNILAGHVEITIYTLLITAYYAAIRWVVMLWRRRDLARAARQGVWLLVMIGMGFALGAVQFVPLLEFVQTNWRAERASLDTVLSYAHPPRNVLMFLMPNVFGNPAHHHVYDLINHQMITAPWTTISGDQAVHTSWLGTKNYVEAALYVGILPLLLAGYALVERIANWRTTPLARELREPPYRAILGSLGLISLTFMFGLPTYGLLYALPGINQLNSPFRWVFALTVCVALLAAFGLDALLRRAAEKESPLAAGIGTAGVGGGLVVLAGVGASYIFYPQLEPLVRRALTELAFADRAFSTAEMFYSYQAVNLATFGVMLLLGGGVFWWAGRIRQYRGVGAMSFFAVLVVILDLMLATRGFNPAVDPALLDFKPPVVQWMQAQQDPTDQPVRYTTLQAPDEPPLLQANITMQYGLDDIRGYDSIIPAHYVGYMRDLAPQVQLLYNRIAPLFTDPAVNHSGGVSQVLDDPLFHLLNVRYVVTSPEGFVPFEEWELVYDDEAVRVWENPFAVPRVFALSASQVDAAWFGDNPDTMPLDFFFRNDDLAAETGNVRIISDSGREKFIDVTLADDAQLIISETHMPGWRAFVRPSGGTEAQEEAYTVERIFGALQTVALPAGDWTVRLVYSPASFQVGVFGSIIGLVAWTLLLGIWLWQMLVGVNTDESSQTARVARNSIAPIMLNLFNRGIDFAFLLVMLRLLPPERVGIYYYLVVLFNWFDLFTNFGLDLFLVREVSREKSRSGHYFYNGTLLRFVLVIVGIVLLGGVLGIRQATVDPALDSDALLAMWLLYFGLFPATLSKGLTSVFYAHEQAEKPAAIATVTSINKAVFGVLALVLGYGIVGLAGVSIINNLITVGVLFVAARHVIGDVLRWRPDLSLLREMLREGFPLMLNHFLATIFFQIDIIILEAVKGAGTVARYSVAYKWVLAINIIPSFFTQALLPVMSRQAQSDKPALKRNYEFGLKLLISVALPVAVGFTVLAEPLTYIMGGAPYLPDGAIAIQLMIWSIPVGWMNSLTQYVLVALDLQRQITRAFIIAVLFNIITNSVLIPQYGYQAAAVTTILSEIVLFVPFLLLTQRGLGAQVNLAGLVWRPLTATGAMIAVTVLLLPFSMIGALLLASMVYLGVLLALNPLTDYERNRLQTMLPKQAARLPFLRPSEQATAGD